MYQLHDISHAFQYTNIKMKIFCACENLLNNKKAYNDTIIIIVLNGRQKFLVEGNLP